LPARYEVATEQEMKLYPSEAFFYTEHLCGLCGEGKFLYMRKTGGKWVVADTASTWIS